MPSSPLAPAAVLRSVLTAALLLEPARALSFGSDQGSAAPVQETAAPKKEEDGKDAAKPDDKTAVPRLETNLTVFAESAPRKAEVSPDVLALPANTMVLTRLAFESKPYRETGEVLRSLPGFDFTYYGQGGIPSGPSVRGYTDRNFGQDIAGHVDGIPLNIFGFVASHGAMDLTTLVPESVERVEVVRGPMSPRYGDFNRGASIDFITRDGITRPSVSIGGGSFGSVRGAATYGNYDASRSRPSVYASVDFNHIDGYAQRQKLDHVRGFARLHIPVSKGDVRISAQAFDSEWEAPSYLDKALVKSGVLSDKAFINPTDGGELANQLAYARYRRGVTPGQEFMLMGYVSKRDWLRFRHDQLISAAQTQVKQVDNRTTWGFRGEKTFAPTLFGRPSQLMIGSHLQRDDAETLQDRTRLRELIDHTDNVDELLTQFAVYAQEQVGVTDRLKLLLGLRYSKVDHDLHDNIRAVGAYVSTYETSQWSPKVGIAATPVRNLDVFVNLATGMRSPTPRTEVRNSIGSVGRVEFAETRSYEGGVRARAFGRLDIQGSLWRADNSNEIRGIPPGGTQFESLGKSRRDGGEIDLRLSIGDTRLYGGLSWVSAELLTPATPGAIHFPDVPDYVHQLGFETTLSVGPGGSSRLTILADLAFHGPKNLNTTGTIKSDTYERATGRVTYAHKSRFRAFLGAVLYPGSRYGESEFLFGTRAGVRPNPKLTLESGLTWMF